MLRIATVAARTGGRQFTSTTSIRTASASASWSSLSAIVGYKPQVNVVHSHQFNQDGKRFFSSNSWNWSQSTDATKAASSSPAPDDDEPETISKSVQTQIMDTCSSLHASVMPLNSKLVGPLAKNSDKGTSLPFVFLVGNHSSGKSSFINYVLGRDVQTAGVAPTDDCFTVVAPGPQDTDQDGPALIGDPDMGFSALRQFGPTLIHHTQLKVRNETNTNAFMMIDSPGMIDSPVSTSGVPGYAGGGSSMDRGYDFQGVVRWFAQRADVVLLFFDPDKPGTTGETLNILLHSLGGMDHKLLIVLNKADQFTKVSFTRSHIVIPCITELLLRLDGYEFRSMVAV
jgi:hypothetical protein